MANQNVIPRRESLYMGRQLFKKMGIFRLKNLVIQSKKTLFMAERPLIFECAFLACRTNQ